MHRLKELFNEWKKDEKYENDFIEDGIIDINSWNKPGNKKVLFVLKEAYDNPGNGDICKFIRDKGEDCLKSRIFRNIAMWKYGIDNTTEQKIEPYVKYENFADEKTLYNKLKSVAWLNLKKKDTNNRESYYEEIREYAKNEKKSICDEIELIDPDIIVCGNVFEILYRDVLEKKPFQRCDNWYYYIDFKSKRRLFIDFYRPSNFYHPLMNYYGLMCIYQQALKNK